MYFSHIQISTSKSNLLFISTINIIQLLNEQTTFQIFQLQKNPPQRRTLMTFNT